MVEREPTVELDERFSSQGAQPRPWSEVRDAIDQAEIFWVSTVRSDGRPHVTPLPAIWLDGALHFCTGPDEQKAKNLATNRQCVLTTGGNAFRSGVDIVIEGTAQRVEDEGQLRQLAGLWRSKLDWPFDVVDGGFRDPDPQGASLAYVFAVAPRKVLAFGKGEPFSQTRYRF
jgi:general stress protein 26